MHYLQLSVIIFGNIAEANILLPSIINGVITRRIFITKREIILFDGIE